MSSQWEMPRRNESCAVCGRRFEVGDVLVASLYEEHSGYVRSDTCATCARPALPIPLASWRTKRPAPHAKRGQAFDREAVLGFFLRLGEPEAPQGVQFRFVLALLLWRKRVLRFDSSDGTGGAEIWRFTLTSTGETFAVQRPDLDEAEIESLSVQLESLLACGTEPEQPAPSDASREAANA